MSNTMNAPKADGSAISMEDKVKSLRIKVDSTSGVKTKSQTFAWGLALIFMLVSFLMAWRSYKIAPPGGGLVPQNSIEAVKMDSVVSKKEAPVSEKVSAKNPVEVEKSQPSVGKGAISLEAKGYVIPMHQIQVSPKVSGMIEKLYFEEGKRVKKGDVLAVLESVDYQSDVDKAKAVLEAAVQKRNELRNGNRPEEIEQTKQEYQECLAQLEQMRLDLQRNRRLTGTASLSQKELEVAQFGYEAIERKCSKLKAGYDLMVKGPREEKQKAAEAEVNQALAELKKAEWRLGNCVVTAPVSGVILTKKAEEGNIVNPAAFNISASLCDMADLTELEVDMSIQERDIASVFKGQKCNVMPEAFQSYGPFLKAHPQGYEGVVSRLMPIADRAKGAIPVRVKITIPPDEEGVYLKPDMGVVVSFRREPQGK